MSVVAKPLFTVDEFLATAEEREGRWELENGTLVAISPERAAHVDTKLDVAIALKSAIARSRRPCRVMTEGLAVRISARTSFEPDALVYCGPRLPPDALEAPDPVIVIEILSPGTAWRDVGAKLIGYLSLPSLSHYLILSPEDRSIVHHRREPGGAWRTDVVSEGALRLDPLGLDLLLNEVFPAE
jgi:Uma2 family endonuclease